MVRLTSPTPTFTPSHRWSLKNNAICGICLPQWLELLWRQRRHVQWAAYWQRVLFVTLIATFNTLLGLVEWLLYRRIVAAQSINPRPLFILGHPRTGTTLLHNLLAKDTEQFGHCSTFCAGFPSAFLWFERFKFLLAGMVDKTRPMDDMELHLDVPQEDELAVSVLSAGISPYMPLTFMTDEPRFRKYFSFEQASEADTRRWVDSFTSFLRKLSLRCGGKRLLLKSPVHTARLRLLLRLYPDAQFVYIHRHPEAVYKSALNMADKQYWYMYLATPTDEQIHEFILNQFVVLWEDYASARQLVPKGNLVEVAYDDLARDAPATIEQERLPHRLRVTVRARVSIYSTLGLEGYKERMRARVVSELARPAVKEHRVNRFEEMPPELKEKVAERWAAFSRAWGYTWP